MTRIAVRTTVVLLIFMAGFPSPSQAQLSPLFTISVSPSIVNVTQGSMTSFTVNIVANDDPVFEFSLKGLPSGVVAQFPLGHPEANTILLSALPGATTGTFSVDVTAHSGNNPQTQTFTLNVHPKPVIKWEYRVEVAKTQQGLESVASSLGQESWQLVSVVLHERDGVSEWVGFFKRQKPDGQ